MRYTVNYCGGFFYGDNENGVNTHGYSNFNEAICVFREIIMSGIDENAYLKDEEYCCYMYWDPKKKECYWS